MSTEVENRLTAALMARAEQVTSADLPALVVPEAPVVPFVRRPVVWGLAAAACIALGVPFAVNGLDRGTDNISPAPAPTTGPPDAGRLTGDLDGDGTDETISIDEHGIISVVLASSSSGTPLTADAGADGSTLVGLVRLDDSDEQSVVADDRGTGRVFRVTQDGLVQVEAVDGQFFYPFTHNDPESTWAVLGDLLVTASPTEDTTVLDAQTWQLNTSGLLASKYIGRVCSGTTAGSLRYCGGGSGVVVGNVLTALYPEATDPIRSGSFPIAIDGGGEPGTVSFDGSTLSVDFHSGSPAEQVTIPGDGDNAVYTTFLSGVEVPGIVVRQKRPDSFTSFYVYTWRNGSLTLLLPEGAPDDLYSGDDQVTWFSSSGQLFTLWPDQSSSNGSYVKMWTMEQDGLRSQPVTAPDGQRELCIDSSVDPVTYGGC